MRVKPTKKRKMAETEAEQRDQAPIIVSYEKGISDEREGAGGLKQIQSS